LVKEEKGDLLADSHIVLIRWNNNFRRLLNVLHVGNDVRQTEIQTAEELVPKPSSFEIEIATENLERFKSPGTYQIPAELIEPGGNKPRSEIHKLISLFRTWKNCHSSGRNLLFYVPIYNNGDKTDCSNY
jgi:hypothetical protein